MKRVRITDWSKVRQIVIVIFLLLAALRGFMHKDIAQKWSGAVTVIESHEPKQEIQNESKRDPATYLNAEENAISEAKDAAAEDDADALHKDINKNDGRIDINTASQADLETLNGIGPAKAKAIIAYRKEYGGFRVLEELMEVKGIGAATFAKIKDSIRL